MSFYDDGSSRRRHVSSVVAYEIEREKKDREWASKQFTYDKDIFDKGICWFQEGFQFEDAPEELKSNRNFINGYELAKRRDKINKSLEIQGALWYYSQRDLNDAQENMRDNEYFKKGYIEAMSSKKRR